MTANPINAPHEKASPSTTCGHQVMRFMNGYTATIANEAMPVAIAKRLNCSNTAKPISACATRNASACLTPTCPAGIGRERVRSTLASRSRSVMSFQVQPAPRMTKEPIRNNARMSGNRLTSRAIAAASAADHQHGSNNSQMGTFSNLGVWSWDSSAAPYLFFTPPCTRTAPIGAAAATFNGCLTLTLALHPFLRPDEAMLQNLLQGWVDRLTQS